MGLGRPHRGDERAARSASSAGRRRSTTSRRTPSSRGSSAPADEPRSSATECSSASGPSSCCPRGAYVDARTPLVARLRFRVDRVENLGADRLLYGSLRDLRAEREDHRQPAVHGALPVIEAGRRTSSPGARVEPQVLRPSERAAGPGAAPCESRRDRAGAGPGALRRGPPESLTARSGSARLMLAPAVLYIALVVVVPFLMAIGYSFATVTIGTSAPRFVGLENFRSRAARTRPSAGAGQHLPLRHRLADAGHRPGQHPGHRAADGSSAGKWLVRLLILLPWVAPVSLGSIGWLWIFDSIYSVINWTLRPRLGIFGRRTPWPDLARAAEARDGLDHRACTCGGRCRWPRSSSLGGLCPRSPRTSTTRPRSTGPGFFRHALPASPCRWCCRSSSSRCCSGSSSAFTDMIVVYVLTRGGPYDSTQVLASARLLQGHRRRRPRGRRGDRALPLPGPGGLRDPAPAARPARGGGVMADARRSPAAWSRFGR